VIGITSIMKIEDQDNNVIVITMTVNGKEQELIVKIIKHGTGKLCNVLMKNIVKVFLT
jgi:hypothetical protein